MVFDCVEQSQDGITVQNARTELNVKTPPQYEADHNTLR